MSALIDLEKMIGDAEKRDNDETLKRKILKAIKDVSEAKSKVELAAKSLAEAKQKYGNPDEIKAERLDKLEEFREKARKLAEHLGDKKMVEEKLRLADLEIEQQWQEGTNALLRLTSSHESAKAELSEALGQCDELRRMSGVSDLEGFTAVSELPASTSEILEEVSRDLSLLVDCAASWSSKERLAMIKIVSGRCRIVSEQRLLSSDEKRMVGSIFGTLSDLTSKYRPGYIAAMDRSATRDWDSYVEDAKFEFSEAVTVREAIEFEKMERRAIAAESRRKDVMRKAESVISVLRDLLQCERSDENKEWIRDTVRVLLKEIGMEPDNEELLELLYGEEELFKEGNVFRALRRHLTKNNESVKRSDVARLFPKAYAALKGKKVIMVGGVAREDRRSKIESVFEMGYLEWVSGWRNEPRTLEATAQKAKSGTVDFVFELASLCGHNVEEILKSACQGSTCRFVRIPQGYGVNRIAQMVEQVV